MRRYEPPISDNAGRRERRSRGAGTPPTTSCSGWRRGNSVRLLLRAKPGIGGQRAAFAGSLAELASPGVQILSEYNLRPQSGHNLDVVETEGGG